MVSETSIRKCVAKRMKIVLRNGNRFFVLYNYGLNFGTPHFPPPTVLTFKVVTINSVFCSQPEKYVSNDPGGEIRLKSPGLRLFRTKSLGHGSGAKCRMTRRVGMTKVRALSCLFPTTLNSQDMVQPYVSLNRRLPRDRWRRDYIKVKTFFNRTYKYPRRYPTDHQSVVNRQSVLSSKLNTIVRSAARCLLLMCLVVSRCSRH